MSKQQFRQDELERGLVLHLLSASLRQAGATCSCASHEIVQDGEANGHFFVCLGVYDGRSDWLPVYSKSEPADGRGEIPPHGKVGHPKWTTGASYFHPKQIWTASAEAIIAAAVAGGDMSRANTRNGVIEDFIPPL